MSSDDQKDRASDDQKGRGKVDLRDRARELADRLGQWIDGFLPVVGPELVPVPVPRGPRRRR